MSICAALTRPALFAVSALVLLLAGLALTMPAHAYGAPTQLTAVAAAPCPAENAECQAEETRDPARCSTSTSAHCAVGGLPAGWTGIGSVADSERRGRPERRTVGASIDRAVEPPPPRG